MNVAYIIDWAAPGTDRWHRKDVQLTAMRAPSPEQAAEVIAVKFDLRRAPIVADGMTIRVQAWVLADLTDAFDLDPDTRDPDSVWAFDPTA